MQRFGWRVWLGIVVSFVLGGLSGFTLGWALASPRLRHSTTARPPDPSLFQQ